MSLSFRPGMDRSGGGGHSVEMARMFGFRRDPKLDTPRGRAVPAAAEFVQARCGDAHFGRGLYLAATYIDIRCQCCRFAGYNDNRLAARLPNGATILMRGSRSWPTPNSNPSLMRRPTAGNSPESFPDRGRRVPGTEMRELVTTYPYIIRYRVMRNGLVRILRARHAAQQQTKP
jgi:hypothetical protein